MDEQISILIFVLDDSEQELELIKRKFDQEHIVNYKLFTSYEEFIAGFSRDVHLTVIDYMLGGVKTGLEILKEIKQINPFCHNIVLTGYGDWKTVRQFFLNGADDFISKSDSNYLQETSDSIKNFLPRIIERVAIVDKWYEE